MKLLFGEDIERDIWNWQKAMNSPSYGVDWKKFLPASITAQEVEDGTFLRDYLEKEFYKSGKVADLREWLEKNVDVSQIEKDLVALMQRPFLAEEIKFFITTFHRAPYDVRNNLIFIFDYPHDRKECITVVYHELMHFLFHWHYWKECRDIGLTDGEANNFKESITVLLEPILQERGLPLDRGYQKHKTLRAQWEILYEENPSFPEFLKKALPIYQQSLTTSD